MKELNGMNLEQFLVHSIYYNRDFCFSFGKIPNDEFVKMFKKKFEKEFMKLRQ